MPEKEDVDPITVKAAGVGPSTTVAQQNMEYTLWRFGTDVHDIGDGESPVGDKLVTVFGLGHAVESAKLLMRQDPTIHFLDLVPKRPGIFCKTVRVRKKIIVGSARQQLNPQQGLDEFGGR